MFWLYGQNFQGFICLWDSSFRSKDLSLHKLSLLNAVAWRLCTWREFILYFAWLSYPWTFIQSESMIWSIICYVTALSIPLILESAFMSCNPLLLQQVRAYDFLLGPRRNLKNYYHLQAKSCHHGRFPGVSSLDFELRPFASFSYSSF